LSSETKEKSYAQNENQKPQVSSVLKVGLISAVSALAGGLAAAWWYRKTLNKLQNPIVPAIIHQSGYPVDDADGL
jgi:hypothetical protein